MLDPGALRRIRGEGNHGGGVGRTYEVVFHAAGGTSERTRKGGVIRRVQGGSTVDRHDRHAGPDIR